MASHQKSLTPLHKKFDFLSVVGPNHGNGSILVRVLRKWRVPGDKWSKLPMSVELVLVDSEVRVSFPNTPVFMLFVLFLQITSMPIP